MATVAGAVVTRHELAGLRAAHRNAVELTRHPDADAAQRADAQLLADQAAAQLARWDR